jgi:hypothetical protein
MRKDQLGAPEAGVNQLLEFVRPLDQFRRPRVSRSRQRTHVTAQMTHCCKLLTRDEARWIVANIVKLPELATCGPGP